MSHGLMEKNMELSHIYLTVTAVTNGYLLTPHYLCMLKILLFLSKRIAVVLCFQNVQLSMKRFFLLMRGNIIKVNEKFKEKDAR